jgi:tRNA(Ile)-lysidine synthase
MAIERKESLNFACAEFAKTNQLLLEGGTVLLAVSGGMDSLALAHIFHLNGWPFAIAHANFQLRGAASDADEAFVTARAKDWNVPFFVRRFDTEAFAQAQGISTQMAARTLRYEWFEAIRSEQGYVSIATAHHLDDQLETLLLQLARRAGLPALGGIRPVQGAVIRPLLCATRDDIVQFVQQNNIAWREDESNATDDYARNALRHHAIPPLKTLYPDFPEAASRSMDHLATTSDNYLYLLRHLADLSTLPAKIEKSLILALPHPADALLLLLSPLGFAPEQVRQMAAGHTKSGLTWDSDKAKVVNDRTHWLIQTLEQEAETTAITIADDDIMVRLPDGQKLFFLPVSPKAPFPNGQTAIVVDAGRLTYPLTVRHWQAGDVFQPFGMDGKQQKLQDFFTNQKYSVADKARTWLLTDATGAIIWVIGARMDERFRVRIDKTTFALKISWQE